MTVEKGCFVCEAPSPAQQTANNAGAADLGVHICSNCDKVDATGNEALQVCSNVQPSTAHSPLRVEHAKVASMAAAAHRGLATLHAKETGPGPAPSLNSSNSTEKAPSMGAQATSSIGRTVSPSVASKNVAPFAFSLRSAHADLSSLSLPLSAVFLLLSPLRVTTYNCSELERPTRVCVAKSTSPGMLRAWARCMPCTTGCR